MYIETFIWTVIGHKIKRKVKWVSSYWGIILYDQPSSIRLRMGMFWVDIVSYNEHVNDFKSVCG